MRLPGGFGGLPRLLNDFGKVSLRHGWWNTAFHVRVAGV